MTKAFLILAVFVAIYATTVLSQTTAPATTAAPGATTIAGTTAAPSATTVASAQPYLPKSSCAAFGIAWLLVAFAALVSFI
jgi:nucleoside permease NupC